MHAGRVANAPQEPVGSHSDRLFAILSSQRRGRRQSGDSVLTVSENPPIVSLISSEEGGAA